MVERRNIYTDVKNRIRENKQRDDWEIEHLKIKRLKHLKKFRLDKGSRPRKTLESDKIMLLNLLKNPSTSQKNNKCGSIPLYYDRNTKNCFCYILI